MILKRLGISIFVLLAVSVLVFIFTLLLPGDPAQALLDTVGSNPASQSRMRPSGAVSREQ